LAFKFSGNANFNGGKIVERFQISLKGRVIESISTLAIRMTVYRIYKPIRAIFSIFDVPMFYTK